VRRASAFLVSEEHNRLLDGGLDDIRFPRLQFVLVLMHGYEMCGSGGAAVRA
jgi:hypothetical protein